MIVTITGLPGNGKTLYTIAYVKEWAEREERPVFYHGIKGLTLPWTECESFEVKMSGRVVNVPRWWLAPARSIVVIDEAQNAGFGIRGRGDTPEHAQMLETHRHLGIDLVFITQSPMLLDAHDRALSERHFHIVRKFGMQRATIHEFSPVRDNVLKSRKDSIRHEWKFPKEVFKWYVSAEAHTHKRRIPLRVMIFCALPFLIGGISWYAWHFYLDPKRKVKAAELAAGPAGSTVAPGKPSSGAGSGKLSATEYVMQYQPRVRDLAYTAPAYDEITKPVMAPYPAACVVGEKSACKCYSQQATRMDIGKEMCEAIARGGFFVAWNQQLAPAQGQNRTALAQTDAGRGVGSEPDYSGSMGSFGGSNPRIGSEKPSPSILGDSPALPPPGRGRNWPRQAAPTATVPAGA